MARAVHCVLGRGDGRRGLKADAQHDRLAIADPTLHAAGAIRERAGHSVAPGHERVIVLETRHAGARETTSDLEALRGRKRQQGPGEVGFELVEDRFTEAQAARHAPRIPPRHPSESPRRRAASIRSVICVAAAASGQRTGFDSTASSVTAAGSILASTWCTRDTHASTSTPAPTRKSFARHRAGGDAAHRLTRARPSAPLPVANAVLGLGGPVGVRGPEDVLHMLVGLRPCVLVSDQDGDRSPEGPALRRFPRGSPQCQTPVFGS